MTTPYQLYSPPLTIPYQSPYRTLQPTRQVLWSPSFEQHPMAPPTSNNPIQVRCGTQRANTLAQVWMSFNFQLSPEQLRQLRREQDYSMEHGSPPKHLTLPPQPPQPYSWTSFLVFSDKFYTTISIHCMFIRKYYREQKVTLSRGVVNNPGALFVNMPSDVS